MDELEQLRQSNKEILNQLGIALSQNKEFIAEIKRL